MKAFFYTLILTVVLIASVIYLQSLRQPAEETPDVSREVIEPPETETPMSVKSDPAEPSNIDQAELENANQDALYETGLELLDLWHLPEAIDVFETLVRKDPLHYRAYLRLVECYSHPMVGEEANAAECLRKAREAASASDGDTLWVSALGSLFGEDVPGAAAEKFTALVGDKETGPDARYFLAMALLVGGDPKGAGRHLEDLLDGDESLGRARELLVQCKVALGELDAAESLAKDLHAIYPEEPYPFVLLSRVLLIQGKVDEAVQYCRNALLLDGRYIPGIVARAHLFVAEGESEAARVSFEKLLLFDKPMLASVAHEGIAYIDFLTGRFDEGSEGMDEAIRLAMSIGSTQRGLLHAFRLVDYLCELGRVDAAEAVLDRWVSRHGEIPDQLGRLRVGITHGNVTEARRALGRIERDGRWRSWMRALAIDVVDFRALTFIKENNFARALEILEASDLGSAVGTRRAYLKGFALFQIGDAEQAVSFFKEARFRFHSLVFPYHSDPILYVQAVFFLAEAAIARGDGEEAARYYREFLDLWGGAEWDLQAVERAREKLETLSAGPPQG